MLDCTHPPRPEPPRNHNDLPAALALGRAIGTATLVLTHIGHAFDAWRLEQPNALPQSCTLAHDGMILDLSEA